MSDVEREAMVEKAAKPNQASLDILVRGAEKTFDNAPYPSDGMIAWPVSARVGNVRNNDSSLIEPVAAA